MGCLKLNYYREQAPFFLKAGKPDKEGGKECMQGWLSVDPLAGKYPSLSPYAYCANNPVILKDPNGKEIWIFYQDDNGDAQAYLYGSAMAVPKNEFVQATVGAINFMKENGLANEINQLSNDERCVPISYAEGNYNIAGGAHWNPNSGYQTKSGEQNEPVYGLANELGHQWYKLYQPSPTAQEIAIDGYTKNPWDHPKGEEARGAGHNPTTSYLQWDGYEEYLVIMKWDNRLLMNNGKLPRVDHKGQQYNTTGTYSTDTQTNGLPLKEKSCIDAN